MWLFCQVINYHTNFLSLIEIQFPCPDPKSNWTPHKVELTLWTHYIGRELKPSIFDDFPEAKEISSPEENGEDHHPEEETENGEKEKALGENGNHLPEDEQSVVPKSKKIDDETELPSEENTNDSHADSGKENVGEIADVVDDEDTSQAAATAEKSLPPDEQPPAKKICLEQ